MKMCEKCYWRFRGDKEWRYGWPTNAGDGMVMMGRWNGDKSMGVVDRGTKWQRSADEQLSVECPSCDGEGLSR